MIKNMTRKGLAIGATAALTLAGLVGFAAPASATTGITVEPSKGTSYTMISGEQLSLRVFGQANYTGGFSALKWEISNPDGAVVTVAQPDGSPTAAETPATTVADGNFSSIGTATASTSSSNATSFVVTPANVTSSVTGANQLGVQVISSVATTIQVRAFIDLNGNGTYDAANDLSANVGSVVFVKPADVTASVSITSPTEADTTVTASVEFNGVNNAQLDPAKVAATFTKGDGSALTAANVVASAYEFTATNVVTITTATNAFAANQNVTVRGIGTGAAINGTYVVTSRTATTVVVAKTGAIAASVDISAGANLTSVSASTLSDSAWSSTKKFEYVATAAAALVKDQAVKVQAVFNGTNIGVAATATIVARKADTIVASTVVSTTANASDAVLLNGSWKVKAVVKDGTADTNPVAGNAVTATVTTNATLAATAGAVVSLTVNGTTHTSTTTLPGAGSVAKLALTTDANGEVFVDLATAGYTNGQTVTVSFVTENLTAATVTNTAATATYTVRQNKAVSAVVDGATAPVQVTVLDQFGGSIAAGYKAYATLANATQTTPATTAASGGTGDVVNGAATLNLFENGTGVGINTYTISVAKVLGNGDYDTALGSTVSHDVHIVAAADLVAAAVDSTTGTKNATTGIYEVGATTPLVLQDNKSYNATTVVDTAPAAFVTAFELNDVALGGTIRTASSATVAAKAVPGASVTISGAGLQFTNTAGVYSADSITVVANASGVYAAAVSSHKAGKQTITVTSGAASSTITITFAAAAGNTGTVLAITAPDNVLPGSTLAASVKLTDKYGNPVLSAAPATFIFSAVSPGIQVGSNPTATDADGVAKLAYFLGNNDKGSIVLTATYDRDGNANTTADRVTVQKTITIGTSASLARGWTKDMGDGTIKVYARDVVGAGKIQFYHNGNEVAWVRATSANDPKLNVADDGMVRTRALVSGRNVFEIYVDGERIVRRIATGS